MVDEKPTWLQNIINHSISKDNWVSAPIDVWIKAFKAEREAGRKEGVAVFIKKLESDDVIADVVSSKDENGEDEYVIGEFNEAKEIIKEAIAVARKVK